MKFNLSQNGEEYFKGMPHKTALKKYYFNFTILPASHPYNEWY